MVGGKGNRKLALPLAALQLGVGIVLLTAPSADARPLPPSEWVIGPHRPNVLITLDGRTTTKHLLDVLRLLKHKRATASFFLPGSWVAAHHKKTAMLHRAGMVIGNRGYGKGAFTHMGPRHIRSSVLRAQKALRKAGVFPRPFFRAPKGARDLRVLRILAGMGYRSVRWTVHPGRGDARQVTHRAMRKVHEGAIVSLDLWRRSNRRALPRIIDKVRARGLHLKTIKALRHIRAVNWTRTLRAGFRGGQVVALEKALHHATYPAGKRDGNFGYEDEQAVIAFEKFHHLARDAVVPPKEAEAIAASRRPRPPKRHLAHYIDVDISRQILVEVKHHKVTHTLPVSTGGEYTYSSGNGTAIAHTPRGHFSIIRKRTGWDVGSLGALWYPNYFVGGFAIHGYPEVPTYPASHGCIRIPMYTAKPFFYREPLGVPVFVHN